MDPTAYYHMPLFKPGIFVQWNHQRETVSHVVVRRHALMVYLVGHESPVYPEALHLAPTGSRARPTPTVCERLAPAKGLRVSPQSAVPWLHPAGWGAWVTTAG